MQSPRDDDLRWLLDSISQGYIAVGMNGRLAGESSAVVTKWFGPLRENGTVWDLMAARAPLAAQELELGWEQLVEGILPLELAIEQLPRRIRVAGRCLSTKYSPTFGPDGALDRILILMSDVSIDLEVARADQEEAEVIGLFSRALRDKSAVAEFFEESRELLAALAGADPAGHPFLRHVHTLKGNAAIYGLESIAETCHQLERCVLEKHGSPNELLRTLDGEWKRLSDKVGMLLTQNSSNNGLLLDDLEYQQFLGAIRRRESHGDLEKLALRWQGEPVGPKLERLAEQARELAQRLGKDNTIVIVDSGGLRIEPGTCGRFWQVAVHAIRNCLDHGLESAEERARAGKQEAAQLSLSARLVGTQFVIEISDNGRGVDWDGLKRVAENRELPSETRQELLEALFTDGVSTAVASSLVSGRGVGMAALAEAVRAAGGSIRLFSEPGDGTRYVMSWPLANSAAQLSTSSSGKGLMANAALISPTCE